MNSNPQEILGSANILDESLKTIYSEQESKIITRWFVEAITKQDWVNICLHPKTVFTDEQALEFQKGTKELLSGRPIQYVIGEAHFFGRLFKVTEAVLIPRQETEELVDWIIRQGQERYEQGQKQERSEGVEILDIGTGSGCIPVTLSLEVEGVKVMGVDVSPEALKIALYNNKVCGGKATFRELDILTANPEEFSGLDMIVSNPPYVLESERAVMHMNVLDHEPAMALFVPDEDALVFYRKILELGRSWLKPGGWVFFEINEGRGKEMLELMGELGYGEAEVRKDLGGRDRMARCQLPQVDRD